MPVRCHTPRNQPEQLSVQWHLQTTEKPGPLLDAIDWAKIQNPDVLASARTFLGGIPRVVVNLGVDLGPGETYPYHKRIGYSRTDNETHKASIQSSSINMGTSSLGIFGANATLSMVYQNSLAHNISGDHTGYLEILDASAERPVILFDDSSAIAYIVKISCLLLHMLHTWAANMKDCADNVPCIEATWDAGTAAHRTLKNQAAFAMRKDAETITGKQCLIRDLVVQFWNNLRLKAWETLKDQIESHPPQVATASQKLYGWEYLDVVWNNPARRKQIPFHGNWKPLAEGLTILFGRNFGEIVKPAPDSQVCSAWRRIPTQQQHLVATIDCLRFFAWKKGGSRERLDCQQLTDTKYWCPDPRDLFDNCKDCLEGQKACKKKLQGLNTSERRRGAGEALIPPKEGAVVFGRGVLERKNERPNDGLDSGKKESRLVHNSTKQAFNILGRALPSSLRQFMMKSTQPLVEDHTDTKATEDTTGAPPCG